MSEADLKIGELKRALEKITKKIQVVGNTAVYAEVYLDTTQSQITELKRQHNIKLEKLESQTKRAVKNAKATHKVIDALLAEKKVLHSELVKASHIGKEACEYCGKYYTPAGLPRHKGACPSKPSVKAVDDVESEIAQALIDLEARKIALKKELAASKKPKPKPKPEPIEEPEAEE